MARLGDYVRIRTGKLDANASSENGQYPFFTCAVEPLKIDRYSYDCECVLVAGNGDLNVKYYDGKFDAYQRTYIIESLDKTVLSVPYLYCFLDKYVETLRQQAIGGVIKYIKLDNLTEAEIPILSAAEQSESVLKLKKANELITLRKEQLAKLDQLVKSRFIELFGDPKHSVKYGTKKLSSCVANKADMVDGPFGSQVNTKVDYIENGEIPVIRTVNVKMMQFSADDLKFMSREKYETVIRSQVLPGDVILTKVGTIGNVCIFPNEYKEAVLSTTGSCRIRVDESIINNVFFAYNLMYLKDKLLEIASTGVQPFLNMNHIKNIDVLDVPFEEQLLFAAFVEQTDKSKFEIQKSLEKLEKLKKALMQKYFG